MMQLFRNPVLFGLLAAACLAGCMAGLARRGPVDLGRGPMDIFDNVCTRCHGVYPDLYRKDVQKHHGAELRAILTKMMRERSKLEASEADVDAMAAYHEALRGDDLFLCILNGQAATGGADVLRGEVSPRAKVEIVKDRAPREAEVRGYSWRLADPPVPPFEVVARRRDAVLRLPFPARQWVHSGANP
jgi:hypothetical protein